MKGDKDLLSKVDRARWWALQFCPFYAQLMMGLADVLAAVKTAATDGKVIRWGREFLGRLTDKQVRFVLLHETLHCAHGHLWRLPYDAEGNQAGDHGINLMLNAAGLEIEMPAGGLCNPDYAKLAEEEIYARLKAGKVPPPEEPQGPEGQPGGEGDDSGGEAGDGAGDHDDESEQAGDASGEQESGSGSCQGKGKSDGDQKTESEDPGGCGGFEEPAADPPPDKGSTVKGPETLKEEWEQRVIQAAMADSATKGTMPAGGKILLERVRGQRIDWRAECAEFVKLAVGTRNDWARSTRRMATAPVIYPRKRQEKLGTIVFVRDTSGSVCGDTIASFNALIEDCLGEVGSDCIVLDCDSEIQGEYKVGPGDEVPYTASGGGGTSFRPPFKRVETLVEDEGLQVAGLVYLTDMQGDFPSDSPDFPVLWVATTEEQGPFGRTVRLA